MIRRNLSCACERLKRGSDWCGLGGLARRCEGRGRATEELTRALRVDEEGEASVSELKMFGARSVLLLARKTEHEKREPFGSLPRVGQNDRPGLADDRASGRVLSMICATDRTTFSALEI